MIIKYEKLFLQQEKRLNFTLSIFYSKILYRNTYYPG